MLENDFLRDKFNEIEILKGKLITYPKECSKDIITQIDILCSEVWGHIEEKKKHKDKGSGKEKYKCGDKDKNKCEYKEKDKDKEKDKEKDKCKSKEQSKCQDKYDDYKKGSDHKHEMNKSCKKDKNCYNKKDHEVVDKVKKIYTGECEICKYKEKRINDLMRMIEDELDEVEFESDEIEVENLEDENLENGNDEVKWSREVLKDLSENKQISFEKDKKKE